MIKRLLLLSIVLYQKTLSLDHGVLGKILKIKICRFYPSCSQYAYGSIDRFGVLRGVRMSLRRLFRCHPFHPGGYDPIPNLGSNRVQLRKKEEKKRDEDST
ncbi:MAG: membrane protein insertion efficiency factor YidD [Candidatus Moraniibacteriota bacterium]|nr:MAG: membrane protein insertion efficiency factor YidD [Candidatus Moranbacteria bacterium]